MKPSISATIHIIPDGITIQSRNQGCFSHGEFGDILACVTVTEDKTSHCVEKKNKVIHSCGSTYCVKLSRPHRKYTFCE